MAKALRIIIFVIVMGTVSGGMLEGIRRTTAPLIAKNEEIKLKSAVLDVLELDYNKDNILDVFAGEVKEIKNEAGTYYLSADNSVAFEFTGSGLWGPISGIASINTDLKSIKIIKILHQEETPGLGARIAEFSYLKQFRGKEFLPKLVFTPQGKASSKNEVDSITGATGSSKALEKLLNEALVKNIDIFKGNNAR